MALMTRRENGPTAIYRARDPFALARELFGWDPMGVTGGQTSAFIPVFEVAETNNEYVVRADVPGVKEGDIDVSLHGNVLTISGTRQSQERREGETFYIQERQYGSFSRAFVLPDECDAEKVEAALKEGVLTVNVPKREQAKPRRIALKK